MKVSRIPSTLIFAFALASVQAEPLAATNIDATLRLDPSSPAGADPQGRVLLYTPNPLELGSSISHWDFSATPDLLMEPAVSSQIPFAQVDLTLPLLQDMGWRRGSSNITLRVLDAQGQGFNDPTFGPQRMAAMQFVANTWAGLLRSNIEINLGVRFDSLSCDSTGAVLAQAGTQFIFESFQGAPLPGVWYHGTLAESLSGRNLSLDDIPANPDAPDIEATFNKDIDNGCLPGTRYYYGLDGNVPRGQVSFISVALHEVGHGLGFSSLASPTTGAFFQDLPDAFSRMIFDRDLGMTWERLSPQQRRQSAINPGKVSWAGQRVTDAARGFLEAGPVVSVSSPPGIAGNYKVATAQFGPPLTQVGLAGSMVLARDGSSTPTLGCNPLVNAAQIQGKIAVIDRGDCFFVDKVKNAQNAGAIATIIVNNVPGAPITLGGDDPSIVIPAVHVSQEDGELFKTVLQVGLPPAAPSDLTAEPAPGGRILLSWRDNSDDEASFRIERKVAGGRFAEIAAVGVNRQAFEDSSVSAGILYTYRVRARNTAGFSPFSNEASASLANLPPEAPSNLRATAPSATEVELTWADNSSTEDTFILQRRTIATRSAEGVLTFVNGPYEPAAEIPADTSSFLVSGLTPETTYNLRLLASNENGESAPSNEATVTTRRMGPAAICAADAESLCLLSGRFQVRTFFRDQRSGAPGTGRAIPGTDETGTYWFFRPDNVELVVKMLDATSFTDAYWFFFGALSDVEYWIVVTDTTTGAVNTYFNSPGDICGQADTRAFLRDGAALRFGGAWSAASVTTEAPSGSRLRQQGAAVETGCAPDPETLCLLDGRFQVRVVWTDQRSGNTGAGMAIPTELSDSTGFFWFFSETNTELVLKMIDATSVAGKFWVFFGALTDVEYEIEVLDTMTGARSTYSNPPGNICGQADTSAFDG